MTLSAPRLIHFFLPMPKPAASPNPLSLPVIPGQFRGAQRVECLFSLPTRSPSCCQAWSPGHESALLELAPLVYDELHCTAHRLDSP